MKPIEFIVPWLGPSLNSIYNSKHWAVLREHKRLAAIAVMVGIGNARWSRDLEFPVIISIKPLPGKGQRRYDMINYALTYKIIEDCLVRRGILPDDSHRYVQAFQIEQPVRTDKRHSETLVRIIHAPE